LRDVQTDGSNDGCNAIRALPTVRLSWQETSLRTCHSRLISDFGFVFPEKQRVLLLNSVRFGLLIFRTEPNSKVNNQKCSKLTSLSYFIPSLNHFCIKYTYGVNIDISINFGIPYHHCIFYHEPLLCSFVPHDSVEFSLSCFCFYEVQYRKQALDYQEVDLSMAICMMCMDTGRDCGWIQPELRMDTAGTVGNNDN